MNNQIQLNGYAYQTASLLQDSGALTRDNFKTMTKEISGLVNARAWKRAEFWALSQHNVSL